MDDGEIRLTGDRLSVNRDMYLGGIISQMIIDVAQQVILQNCIQDDAREDENNQQD